MRRLLINWLAKLLLSDFGQSEQQMSDGEHSSAMKQLNNAPQLQKYLNILIGNLIRRHLYIKNMDEGSWYLGQISALRKLQKDAERWMNSQNT